MYVYGPWGLLAVMSGLVIFFKHCMRLNKNRILHRVHSWKKMQEILNVVRDGRDQK